MKPGAVVTVDARWLAGGVGTYAVNIIREIRQLNLGLNLQVLTTAGGAKSLQPFCDELTVVRGPIFSMREQWDVAHAAAGSDLLHCTHYNAPLLRRGPLVVTIPDVIPLIDSNYHSSRKSRLLAQFALRTIARRADHIITVSEYSRARIVEALRVPAEKISVAYNGVSDAFRPMEPHLARTMCSERLDIREPFLLYVGNVRTHKNVGALLRAYKQCRQFYRTEQHLVLISTGTPRATSSLRHLAAELGVSDFVHLVGSVDEAALIAAYNAADAVVIPSLEEGFCLPVVEAMACGTPVVCSETSALPEIAGNAAAYFDPRNPANIADIIQTVLERNDLRQYMRARGLAVAAQYEWVESARIHLRVYSKFIDMSLTFQPCNQSGRTGSERVALAHIAPASRA